MDHLPDSMLDRGLAAAFGADTYDEPAEGIVATLEDRLGFRSRVVLRDDESAGDVETVCLTPVTGEAGRRQRSVGRYEVHGEIARGGMGIVFRSRDNDLGRDVAMKVLQTGHAGSSAMVQRFVEEAQITGQLQHPGILPVYEMGVQDAGRPFFTMKLVRGRTLTALLGGRTSPTADRTRLLSIFLHIAQTLAYAHARGVIHRDLKPGNIMVGPFGEVQVVDWGLAKVLAAQHDEPPSIAKHDPAIETVRTGDGSQSLAGSVMGTPAYMAPEQARGEVDLIDERTDVFALGGILCEILAGRAPYTGNDNLVERARSADLDDARAALSASGADIALIDLAVRCLAPAREDRPHDARAVADAIEAHQTDVEERARRSELAAAEARARAFEERRARRLTVALAASILTVLVVAGAAVWWTGAQRENRRAEADARLQSELNGATRLFAEAKFAPIGSPGAWIGLESAILRIESIIGIEPIDDDARANAIGFVEGARRAARERHLAETVEDVIVISATNFDPESWTRMESELRDAFREFGIDLDTLSRDEVARRIRESELTRELADGLELWIATHFSLASWNAARMSPEEMFAWVPVLFAADPDPFRTRLREIFYSAEPSEAALQALIDDTPDLGTKHPRTLSWLASAWWRTGRLDRIVEVFELAVLEYPTDFMLSFDYAFHLAGMERWNDAIPYYIRCLGIRPDTPGIWRGLGVALRETDDLSRALTMLHKAIDLDDDYAPLWADFGYTKLKIGDTDGAMAALDHAIELNETHAIAHGYRGLTLQELDRYDDALAALRRCDELSQGNTTVNEPARQWLRDLEAIMNEDDKTNPQED